MSSTESPAELLERLAREREARPVRRELDAAVTGSRHAKALTRAEESALLSLVDRLQVTRFHHGAAPGYDTLAAEFLMGERPWIEIVPHPANWRPHGPSGPVDYGAGPKRNRSMMIRVRLLIAFPGGKGTRDCIGVAERQSKPVFYIEEEMARLREALQQDHLDLGVYTS